MGGVGFHPMFAHIKELSYLRLSCPQWTIGSWNSQNEWTIGSWNSQAEAVHLGILSQGFTTNHLHRSTLDYESSGVSTKAYIYKEHFTTFLTPDEISKHCF